MPIPPMLTSPATLPPFVGTDPTIAGTRSPYVASIEEVVQRFNTTPARKDILTGLIAYRREVRRLKFNAEFQWIAGSFVENPGREPRDVDIVTFYDLRPAEIAAIQADAPRWNDLLTLANNPQSKASYLCDAYVVNMNGSGRTLVDQCHYWYGLFSHQRGSFAWKGLIVLDARSPDDDVAAEHLLTMVP